ncbi:DUF6585 family protein [Nostoc sp. ChiQUE01b]|uniref:DUF6585 family protein n=1 Tax=Nostoc sp. ChiQUE01b TaxID=3075376 RepID=UPI002AD1E96B|nr:DUF6585 family protein [Nostoc sp. ChiQUE01b]MDZ8262844.1 hypothetical protein [Nostoc sp. ChiQUE01b]
MSQSKQHLNHPILGKLVKEFRPKISRKLITTINITLVFIYFGFVFGVFPLFIVGLQQGSFSLILVLGCLIVSGVLAYRIVNILKDRLFIYDKGLVYQSSNKTRVINFSDIMALWQYSARYYLYFIIPNGRTTYEYTIETKDGKKIVIDEIIANEELGKYLNYELFKHLMPSLKFNYALGKEVVFGEITISKKGIKVKNATLPWLDIKSIDISAGKLYIKKKNSGWLDKNWYVTEVSTIYNLYIFIEMTNAILNSGIP